MTVDGDPDGDLIRRAIASAPPWTIAQIESLRKLVDRSREIAKSPPRRKPNPK